MWHFIAFDFYCKRYIYHSTASLGLIVVCNVVYVDFRKKNSLEKMLSAVRSDVYRKRLLSEHWMTIAIEANELADGNNDVCFTSSLIVIYQRSPISVRSTLSRLVLIWATWVLGCSLGEEVEQKRKLKEDTVPTIFTQSLQFCVEASLIFLVNKYRFGLFPWL